MTAAAATVPVTTPAPGKPTDIPGWFFWIDRTLFEVLLTAQGVEPAGDLVELGTYLGKSAVLIGRFRRPEERFVALDLFGRTDLVEEHADNRAEVERSYASLTRATFERNYLTFHAELPVVVEAPSSQIGEHVAPASVRFLHVDASHLYEHVRLDAQAARTMLRPGGVVVFDDWRSEHTPGVTAAVWEAVFCAGMIPVAVTPHKLYAVFSEPDRCREALGALVASDRRIWSETQQIAGHPVLRLKLREEPKPAAAAPVAPSADVVRDVVKAVREENLRSEDRLATQLRDTVARQTRELRRSVRDASTLMRLGRRLRRR